MSVFKIARFHSAARSSAGVLFFIICAFCGNCFQANFNNPLDINEPSGLILFNLAAPNDASGGGFSGKYLFITSSQTSGGFGSISAADGICDADAAKPSAGTYKAFMVDGNVDRRASASPNAGDSQVDWVLKANTDYYRSDNTFVATSTSVALLPSGLDAVIDPGASKTYWTGMAADWTTANHCSNWGAALTGDYGSGASTTNHVYDGNAADCGPPAHYILCVEQ